MAAPMHLDPVSRIRTLSSPLSPGPTDVEARKEPLAHIRAVLFDVYGTLLISLDPTRERGRHPAMDEAFMEAWSASGSSPAMLPAKPDLASRINEHLAAAIEAKRKSGSRHPEIDVRPAWRGLLSEILGLSPKKLDSATVERFSIELECRINPIWPMPGLTQTLTGLRDSGLKLGVLSDAQFYTPLELEAAIGHPMEEAGLDPRCCIYSYAIEEAKPSPRLYEEAMIALENEHAILCDEVLYVGSDLREDIPAASALGFKTALFAGDARSLRGHDEALEGTTPSQPDRVVTELPQLVDLVRPPKRRRSSAEPGLEEGPDAGD